MEFLLFTVAATLLFWISYGALFVLIPAFFNNGALARPELRSLYSLLLLASLNILLSALQLLIPEPFWANRFQHTMGGVVAFVMVYLVIRDTHTTLTRLQFFVFGFLIVTALGVANEILEFFLQQTTGLIFTDDIFDTWLDLFSNTNGAIIAGGLLTLLIPRGASQKLPDNDPASKYYYIP